MKAGENGERGNRQRIDGPACGPGQRCFMPAGACMRTLRTGAGADPPAAHPAARRMARRCRHWSTPCAPAFCPRGRDAAHRRRDGTIDHRVVVRAHHPHPPARTDPRPRAPASSGCPQGRRRTRSAHARNTPRSFRRDQSLWGN